MSNIQKILQRNHKEETAGKKFKPLLRLDFQRQEEGTEIIFNNDAYFTASCSSFPAKFQTCQQYGVPFGFTINPQPNYNNVMSELRADKIPRCGNCHAFMNCYNRFVCNGHTFVCVLCRKETKLNLDYFCPLVNGDRTDRNQKQELTYSSYQSYFPEHLQVEPITASRIIFLIDVSQDAHLLQTVEFTALALRQVVEGDLLNGCQIKFFTYDTMIHGYDLSGQTPKKLIYDSEIDFQAGCLTQPFENAKTNLLEVIDSLDEMSREAPKSSILLPNLQRLLKVYKDITCRYVIITAGRIFPHNYVNKQKVTPPNPQKSLYEPPDQTFFNQHVNNILTRQSSLNIFSTMNNDLQLILLSDLLKLTNSTVQMYNPQQDNMALYYHLYNCLATPSLTSCQIEVILQRGWDYAATYSNMYRGRQQQLIMKMGQLHQTRSITLTMASQSKMEVSSFFAAQVIKRFNLNGNKVFQITTYGLPLTLCPLMLTLETNFNQLSASMIKMALSELRLKQQAQIVSKLEGYCGNIYRRLQEIYIERKAFPFTTLRFFLRILNFVNSSHVSPQRAINMGKQHVSMDRLVVERNNLQGTTSYQVNCSFLPEVYRLEPGQQVSLEPYEFNLEGQIQPGLYLLDLGWQLQLQLQRLSKSQVAQLFGESLALTEEALQAQGSAYSNYVISCIDTLRSWKPMGWVPLTITSTAPLTPLESWCWHRTSQPPNLDRFFDRVATVAVV